MKAPPCTRQEAQARLQIADAYLQSAKQILAARDADGAFFNVAAGLAILAGIASSDAICCKRLGKIHRGQNHREAADLLKSATPDGKALSDDLAKLLDIKDAAHYGVFVMARGRANLAVRWASHLLTRATEEMTAG